MLALAALHVSSYVAVARGLEFPAPAVAATIYGPLALLELFGLPVFGPSASGGWPSPSPLGWLLAISLWLLVWALVGSLIEVIVRASQSRA